MEIVETHVFHKQVKQLLDEITYEEFKIYLICNPQNGKLIKGGKGIKKIRWRKKNTGKRGGIRILHFQASETRIYLLCCYAKNKSKNITKKQLKELAIFIECL